MDGCFLSFTLLFGFLSALRNRRVTSQNKKGNRNEVPMEIEEEGRKWIAVPSLDAPTDHLDRSTALILDGGDERLIRLTIEMAPRWMASIVVPSAC